MPRPRALVFPVCVLILASLAIAQAPITSGKPVTIEIEPDASSTLVFTAAADGEASLWAASEGLDVSLEVLGADGARLAFDDDSGGLRAAHIYRAVSAGDSMTLVVTAKEGKGGPCRVGVRLIAVVPEHAALLDRVNGEADELERLLGGGDHGGATRRATSIEAPPPPASGAWPRQLIDAVDRLAFAAAQSQATALAGACWDMLQPLYEATLPPAHRAIQINRANRANVLKALGDFEQARRLEEKVLEVFGAELPADHPNLQMTRLNHAATLFELREFARARAIQEEILKAWRASRPADDFGLLQLELNLSSTLAELGDLEAACAMEAPVVAALERLLPPAHPDLQRIRMNHAVTLNQLGDLEGACALEEKVLGVWSRVLPPAHPELVEVRENHASTLRRLGRLAEAAEIQEGVLAIRSKSLAADDVELHKSRARHAAILRDLGEFEQARALVERAAKVITAGLPANHPDALSIRADLALSLRDAGEIDETLRIQREVLEQLVGNGADDDPRLLRARLDYAVTLAETGDIDGALTLQEQVLAVHEAGLADDHPDLLRTRAELARTLRSAGQLARARALLEGVIESMETRFPSNHRELQQARLSLGATVFDLGDAEGALPLIESVVVSYESSFADDNPALQIARMDYAAVLSGLGRLEEAKTLYDKILAIDPASTEARQNYASIVKQLGELELASKLEAELLVEYADLPPAHPFVRGIRLNHANTLVLQGDLEGALALVGGTLRAVEGTLDRGHPELEHVRFSYAGVLHALATRDPATWKEPLIEHVSRFLVQSLEDVSGPLDGVSPRQLAHRVKLTRSVAALAHMVIPVDDVPDVSRRVLVLTERLRGLSSRARRLTRVRDADEDGPVAALLRETARRRDELEAFLKAPTLGEDAPAGETVTTRLAHLARRKEQAEVELLAALTRSPGARELVRPVALDEISARLGDGCVAVSFADHHREIPVFDGDGPPTFTVEEHVVASILGADGDVTAIDLGPVEPVREAITAWRRSGATTAPRGIEEDDDERPDGDGKPLRRLVLDPVLARLGKDVSRLVVTLADDMHLFPLDALPLDDGRRVGDIWEVNVVGCLEWLAREPARPINASGFVGFGHADFLGEPAALESPPRVARLRGHPSWGREFEQLPFTRTELTALRAIHEQAFGGEKNPAATRIFMGAEADETRFRLHAPSARFLHLATHGWFAPDSIRSIRDELRISGLAAPITTDFRDQVSGYAPLELCGLALAGANRDARADGSRPGLLTGEEIADVDLSGVELAVLSACETNVGIRRGGQGILSLQEALFTAGVRYSLTSLWNVPDEATMKLMTRFYDGIWRRGETKREALWQAKLVLRNARDPRTGKPRYGLKDWAGWVLYGNPE